MCTGSPFYKVVFDLKHTPNSMRRDERKGWYKIKRTKYHRIHCIYKLYLALVAFSFVYTRYTTPHTTTPTYISICSISMVYKRNFTRMRTVWIWLDKYYSTFFSIADAAVFFFLLISFCLHWRGTWWSLVLSNTLYN